VLLTDIVLALTRDGVREWLHRWAPAADWAVAFGTILLAIGTVYLARQARKEATAVRRDADAVAESVKLQQQQIEAGYRPNVFPIASREWAVSSGRYVGVGFTVLPLKNSGPGVALNVNGELHWRHPGAPSQLNMAHIVTGTIAAADELDARLTSAVGNWEDVRGFVGYRDLMGQEWRTHFAFSQLQGQISVEIGVIAAGPVTPNEPTYPPAEWREP
jgi:hypothetical protein